MLQSPQAISLVNVEFKINISEISSFKIMANMTLIMMPEIDIYEMLFLIKH
jgi:hypothetical protein